MFTHLGHLTDGLVVEGLHLARRARRRLSLLNHTVWRLPVPPWPTPPSVGAAPKPPAAGAPKVPAPVGSGWVVVMAS